MPDLEFKDCIVIGAGPGGMTAALYLNRCHRNVSVLDAGYSRALDSADPQLPGVSRRGERQ